MARGGRLKEEIVTEASSNSIDESEPEHQGVDASDRRARLRFQNRAGPAKLDKMLDKTGGFFFRNWGVGEPAERALIVYLTATSSRKTLRQSSVPGH